MLNNIMLKFYEENKRYSSQSEAFN